MTVGEHGREKKDQEQMKEGRWLLLVLVVAVANLAFRHPGSFPL
ncbi:hypothetical protein ACWCPJ_12430 [Streptomyces collinus]